MCGICGIAQLDGSRPDRDELERMNGALVHRGPDSAGLMVDGPVGLAMRRLSIIDLAGGDQPIANEDGTVHVIQNGEIYNYRELREELEAQGHRFRTHSDTEVIVHLYEQHGTGAFERLRGMFGVAIWDAPRGRLVLARDRYGIKPLYWSVAGGTLSWGSELKALLRRPGFPREVDLEALEAYLAFNWVPTPLTIFKAARKLEAGHFLVWEGGDVRRERYARPAPVPAGDERTESVEELAAELLERLRDSVRAHLVADVPVGVLLSGGVDSCTLAALAAQESGERLATFSIGFEDRAWSELDLAKLVADRYGTDHHELIVHPSAVDTLPELATIFDEPFADSSALPTLLVSRLAAEHVKVCFSGEGGDELFAGYNTYQADLLAPRVGRLAALARPLVERLPSGTSRRLEDRVKRFARAAHLPPLEAHLNWSSVFSDDARAELLARRGEGAHPHEPARARYAETAGATELARLQDVDLGVQLVDDMLAKTDRASMAVSLESRVPFLDPAVVDFALALPTRMKVRGRTKKLILRRAAASLLPEEILTARKRGFSIPAAAWLRGPLEPFAREVLAPERVREQGFLRPEAVTRLIDTHVAGREDLSRQIWGLLTFSLWFDRYARGTVEPPAATQGAAG
jgi:asparagine synthase (glutamine-hydrolysing)